MFKGSIVALITPFTEKNEVDVAALEALVEWHVEAGTDAVMCLGTTGEATTLTAEERQLVIERVVKKAAGRVPVIAGTGCNATNHSVERTKEAKALGVDGCLVIVPYYNKPTPEGCLRHFEEVAKVGLPMIAYHHPGRTGLTLPVNVLTQIGAIPNVVAIKEVSGDLELAEKLCQLTSCHILAGDDNLTLPLMAKGGKGVCSIVANLFPKEWKEMIRAYEKGDVISAQHIADKFSSLCNALVLEINPQGVKYALSLIGKCQPYMRLPLLEPREETKRQIFIALQKVEQEHLLLEANEYPQDG